MMYDQFHVEVDLQSYNYWKNWLRGLLKSRRDNAQVSKEFEKKRTLFYDRKKFWNSSVRFEWSNEWVKSTFPFEPYFLDVF